MAVADDRVTGIDWNAPAGGNTRPGIRRFPPRSGAHIQPTGRFHMPRCSRLRLASLTVMLGTLFQPALADITLTDTLSAYGDSRIGYFNQHRHERDRSSATNDEFRLRLRGGLKWRPDDHWTVAARLAG